WGCTEVSTFIWRAFGVYFWGGCALDARRGWVGVPCVICLGSRGRPPVAPTGVVVVPGSPGPEGRGGPKGVVVVPEPPGAQVAEARKEWLRCLNRPMRR